jgi:hypothetical protein
VSQRTSTTKSPKRRERSKAGSGPVGGYRSQLTEDGTVIVRLDRLLDPGVRRGDRLEVGYLRADPQDPRSAPLAIREVRLVLPHGATASDVRRFGWTRWLAVADAISRWRADDESAGEAITRAGTTALRKERILRARRPGRRGHPDEFYRQIAARYVAVRAAGVRNPRVKMADEMHVSVHTVAGWIERARELGYLQPAHARRRT